jgi:hypothetical protein
MSSQSSSDKQQQSTLQVVLVWRGESDSTSASVALPEDFDPNDIKVSLSGKNHPRNVSALGGTSRKETSGSNFDNVGIVMEVGKSDIDASQVLYLLQTWLEALHSRPNPKRLSSCTDVLR